jgi:hypothetical protein
MALIDKLARDGDPNDPWISYRAFSAGMYFWALGEITRQDVIDAFSLEATDETQLDELASYYTGLSADEKAQFFDRLFNACVLLREGHITRNKFKSLLGLS